MYFGSPVAGPFTVGVSVLSLILCIKKKKNKNKQTKKKISLGAFWGTTETRCSSSLTEATKHLAKGGDEMAVTLEMHHVDTGEFTPLHTASLSD